MNKQIVAVPKGIQFLTQWPEFCLPDHPCIIDKKLTGCGFTEYVIRGNFNAILISPRKPLLENKIDQHNPKYIGEDGIEREISDQRQLYYARSDEQELGIDKDIQNSKNKNIQDPKNKNTSDPQDNDSNNIDIQDNTNIFEYKKNLREAIEKFFLLGKPVKICVTYDSFRKVKEVLKEERYSWLLDNAYFVVDEMQAVFTDSKFKSNTELEFVEQLKDLQKVSFVSATPMMEDYLDYIDEFKDLPYYELDWQVEDPSRVIIPDIVARPCKSINEVARKIISEFTDKNYQRKTLVDQNGIPSSIIESRELIIYVNSIKNITDIIRQNKLTVESTNVICARNPQNAKKIREAFKQVYRELGRNVREIPKEEFIIGSVPIPSPTGEYNNKPITLCTKTVYLGADFYSKCARSIVLSDATVECLAVDITLDLPQIIGRQRDLENPWKNSLEVYFKEGNGVGDLTQEKFTEILESKIEKTKNLLNIFEKGNPKEKHDLAEVYEDRAKSKNYREDYVSVNRHAGSDLKPQFNNLVMIAEKRSFDIQQKDYKDRFTVFNKVGEVFGKSAKEASEDLSKLSQDLENLRQFPDRMKFCCEWLSKKGLEWCNYIPEPYRTYIQTLGIDFIITSSYRKYNLDEAMIKIGVGRLFSPEDLDEIIVEYFKVGEKYSKAQIKSDLQEIYLKLGLPGKVKATDLEKWFEVRPVKIPNKETGKRDMGFEIVKIKE